MTDFNLTSGIPDTVYHSGQSLSSTGARKLLECPARFKWERDNPPMRPPFRGAEFGNLAHTLILGEGSEIVVLDPATHGLKADGTVADNPRATASWKRADAEARERGALPVHVDEYNAAKAMHDSVMAHPVAGRLFAEGVAERSGFWRDEATGVDLRFRPDWLTHHDGEPVCVDLKTAASADPSEFQRSVAKWGYAIQAAWYQAGLAAHDIDARFLFVVVEKTQPFPVSVIELDDEALTEGRRLMRQAIDRYVQCTETGIWPAYGDDITLIGLPAWALPEMEII